MRGSEETQEVFSPVTGCVHLNLFLAPAAWNLCARRLSHLGDSSSDLHPGGEQWGTFWPLMECSAATKHKQSEYLGAMWEMLFE